MVTLSCLIVQAGIYSQVNATIPSSSSPKLIDVFFFVAIFRLFLVCVHLTVICRLVNYYENVQSAIATSNTEELENPKAQLGNRIIPNVRVDQPSVKRFDQNFTFVNNNWIKEHVKAQTLEEIIINIRKWDGISFAVLVLIDATFFFALFMFVWYWRKNIEHEFHTVKKT